MQTLATLAALATGVLGSHFWLLLNHYMVGLPAVVMVNYRSMAFWSEIAEIMAWFLPNPNPNTKTLDLVDPDPTIPLFHRPTSCACTI